jgi:hypothetical protein
MKQWKEIFLFPQSSRLAWNHSFKLSSNFITRDFLSLGACLAWLLSERISWLHGSKIAKKKRHGLSPLANYTDRASAACRRSDC